MYLKSFEIHFLDLVDFLFVLGLLNRFFRFSQFLSKALGLLNSLFLFYNREFNTLPFSIEGFRALGFEGENFSLESVGTLF